MDLDVDYSARLYAGYAEGRALGESAIEIWKSAFSRNASSGRPLTALDLGCGTGRFTPVLADLFGGPVVGVEPAQRMLSIAETKNRHPEVSYILGDAENIPLDDNSCDLALLFLMFHHVPNRDAAAQELARVLRPGGRVLLVSSFGDRLEERLWFQFFPRARQIEERMFPSFDEVTGCFADSGFNYMGLDRVECEVASSFKAYADKISHRAIPTFEHLEEDEIETGFSLLYDAVSKNAGQVPVRESADVLVFELRADS
jgi:ubiquinone/menaquinone biosynthesis C-methylase UbiE